MKRESLSIVLCAIIIALTVVLGWMPYVFLLPVLFASCCFGYRMSLFSSAVFGIVSLVFCMIVGASTPGVAWYFLNYPWMPLVPRLFVGVTAHTVYILMKRLVKEKGAISKAVPISLAAIAGSLTNTVLVGLCILNVDASGATKTIGLMDLVFNGSIEAVLAAVVLPAIVLGVRKAVPLFDRIEKEKAAKAAAKQKVKKDAQPAAK